MSSELAKIFGNRHPKEYYMESWLSNKYDFRFVGCTIIIDNGEWSNKLRLELK